MAMTTNFLVDIAGGNAYTPVTTWNGGSGSPLSEIYNAGGITNVLQVIPAGGAPNDFFQYASAGTGVRLFVGSNISGSPDCYIEADFAKTDAGGYTVLWLVLRATGALGTASFYAARFNFSGFADPTSVSAQFYKCVSGTLTAVGTSTTITTTPVGAANHKLARFTIVGNVLTSSFNSVAGPTYTDSTSPLTAVGKAGFGVDGGEAAQPRVFGVNAFHEAVIIPVLTLPTGVTTASTTATVGATTDTGSGTLYAQILPAATAAPAAATIIGAPTASVAVSSTGAKTVAVTGLTAATAYKAHIAQTGPSNVVSSASFTTNAAITFTGTIPAGTGTVSVAFSWAGSALSSYFSLGTPPYTYSVSVGTLPAGLSLSTSTGVISGVPTAVASSTITVLATDSVGGTAATNSFTLTTANPTGGLFSGSVVLGSTVGNASLGGSSGRLLSPPLRTNNGTLLVSAPLNFVRIYSLAGVLLYEQLGGTTDALGQINVVTSAVQAGVSIRVDWETAAGQRRMPVTVTV